MIISGDFIAINSKEDFVPFEDDEAKTPDGIWFNVRNIVCLSCYKDHYRLVIDGEHMVELRQPAANNLIALMRKERDNENNKFINKIKKLNEEICIYGYRLCFDYDKDKKITRVVMREVEQEDE